MIITSVVKNITNTKIKLSTKIEQIVFTHLLRYSKNLSEGLTLYNGPYFWGSQKGKEIDFLIDLKNKFIPIEVKFQNNISPSDYFTMKKVFQKGILITKNTLFKKDNIIALPIESFLLFVSIIFLIKLLPLFRYYSLNYYSLNYNIFNYNMV